jgi:hypothetical protein
MSVQVGAYGQAAAEEGVKVKGLLGLPWGSTLEDAKKQFPNRSGARLDRINSDDRKVLFNGGKFAGFRATSFLLHFVNGRFWKGDIRLESKSAKHQTEFATLKRMLTEKYGPPARDVNSEAGMVAEWYLEGVPHQDHEKIVLDSDAKGTGAFLFYASDRTRKELETGAAKVEPARTPLKVAPSAKDDL